MIQTKRLPGERGKVSGLVYCEEGSRENVLQTRKIKSQRPSKKTICGFF